MQSVDINSMWLDALHAITTAALDRRRLRASEGRILDTRIRSVDPFNWGLAQSVADAESITRDPVAFGLAAIARTAGERLYAAGGIPALEHALKSCADASGSGVGWVSDFLNAAWDGIGRDSNSLGWCS